MKYLFSLSLLLMMMVGLLTSSCKKSANSGNYQLLDTGSYKVKKGTIVVKTIGTSTFNASVDNIVVKSDSYGIQVLANSASDMSSTVSLYISKSSNGVEFINDFGLMQFLGIKEYLTIINTSAKATVNDYNNGRNGTLLNAQLNFPFSEVPNFNTQVGVGSASIDLKLNEK